MAERKAENRLSVSPKEDFDPLSEEFEHIASTVGDDADCSDDCEDDTGSQCNSLDPDADPEHYFGVNYSITPPVDSRQMKRDKSKKHSHVQKTSFQEMKKVLEVKRKSQNKGHRNIIKERYGEGPVFSLLSGVDSDDNLERDFVEEDKEKKRKDNRETKKKSITTARAHERFAKRNSGDLTALNTETAEVPFPVVTKLDSSGRFSMLGHKPSPLALSGSGMFGGLSGSWGRDFRSRQSVANVDCPKDRVEFHRIFSTLIHMGSQGKKDRDGKKDKKDKSNLNPYKRQLSSEMEDLQERFSNFLWFELQIEVNGLTEEKLRQERNDIPQILTDIRNFKLEVYCDALEDLEESGIDENHLVNLKDDSHRKFQSEYAMILSPESLYKQKEAMKQVDGLLNKLDYYEQMFPSSKAFAKDYPTYSTKEFVDRVKSLYLWLNITRDLCHKTKILGRILGVQHLTDTAWPQMDFESPRCADASWNNYTLHRCSIPELQEPDTTDTSDDNFDDSDDVVISDKSPSNHSAKRVQFDIDSAKSSRATSPLPLLSDPTETSTPLKAQKTLKFWTGTGNLSHVSSEASIDDSTKYDVYRKYVDKTLRRMGMNKMLVLFRVLLDRTLQRAKEALERRKGASITDVHNRSPVDDRMQISSSPSLDLQTTEINKTMHYLRSQSELDSISDSWVEQFQEMGLPSFRPSYLFLLQVFLEVIHEALRLRLEQRPIGEPSFLSIRPLLRECKDVLRGAVLVKQYYQHMVSAVRHDDEMEEDEEKFPDLEEFDDDMKKMLEIYFMYVQNWLIMLQNLPEASLSLKNVLEQEWSFTKQICPSVVGGEAEAGKRFSTLASSLLNSIADFLDTGIDEFSSIVNYDWVRSDDEEEEEEEEEEEVVCEDETRDDEEKEREQREGQRMIDIRHSFQKTSRKCKSLFNEARERASKALGFAKTLRKDLEIAADFNIAVTTVDLLRQFQYTSHVLVECSINPGYLMFIPSSIVSNRHLILQLLNVTCGREDFTMSLDINHKEEGYLLMVNCSGGSDHKKECPEWTGETIKVEPTADTAIALSHIEVDGLLLVVIHSSQLMTQRKQFESQMGKTVELVNEQTSCHQAIAESLRELKEAAEQLLEKVVSAIKEVDKKLDVDEITSYRDESEKQHLLNLYRETMLKGYNFGFEYLREVTRLVTGEPRQKLGRRLVTFARDWMTFVMKKCEKGRGMRPKWANQGFDFLIVACEPRVLAYLSETEFQDLKHEINNCISHVIGQAERGGPVSPTHGPGMHISRSTASDLGSGRQPQFLRFPSWPAEQQGKVSRSPSTRSAGDTPPTPLSADSRCIFKRNSAETLPEVDLHDGEDGGIVMDILQRRRSRASSADMGHPLMPRKDRIMEKINKMEKDRDEKLHQKRSIGRKTSRRNEPEQRINARRVNFRWQRGTKIGEGQFGKVYSAVNMDTGELMAMKEMKFQVNDQQALKELADEIILFEGIQHNNLVKYYGVEVHRDEMLIFMEYCDRGTLEEAARMGLPESLIRIYVREILLAVQHLHDNNIVHRDIKGANIFLTSSGTLKLGDFGSSVKLKSHTTMPGEFNNLVGTTAYMAPEVITKNDMQGHGRAADIWSLGCVVVETTTGKRPWHEFENNFQIMFKVGMGGTPAIPEILSPEGKNFLSRCFVHDPSDRWMATQLLDHPFVKVELQEQENMGDE